MQKRETSNYQNSKIDYCSDYKSYGNDAPRQTETTGNTIERAILDDEFRTDHSIIIETIKQNIKERKFNEAKIFIDKYKPVAQSDPAFSVLSEAVAKQLVIENEIIKIRTMYDITDTDNIRKRTRLCNAALKIDPRNPFFKAEIRKLVTNPLNKSVQSANFTGGCFEYDSNTESHQDSEGDSCGNPEQFCDPENNITFSKFNFIFISIIAAAYVILNILFIPELGFGGAFLLAGMPLLVHWPMIFGLRGNLQKTMPKVVINLSLMFIIMAMFVAMTL